MPLSLAELQRFAESSAAVRLLRGDDAIEDLAFLFFAFRDAGEVTIPASEFKSTLSAWLDATFDRQPDQRPSWTPAERITFYVRQEFLRKRDLDGPEPGYELTADVDRLLTWVEDQRRREFVGTEYGLQAIMRDLRDLSARTTGDWEARLDTLQKKRRELDAEIEAIQRNPVAAPESNVRYTLETLQRLERASQDLIGDFALLRERFAELARQIAREQGAATSRRGDVLRLALDGEDALRRTPMGESFYGFWRLAASSERDEFVRMVNAIYEAPGVPEDLRDRRFLKSLLDRLREQGQIVLDANRQLTRQLRRALDKEEIENRRLMNTRMSELRLLTLGHMDELREIPGIEVDERISVVLPTDRPLFDPPMPVVVDTVVRPGGTADLLAAAEEIARAGFIHFGRLAETIRTCLAQPAYSTGVLLSAIVDHHPPKEGLLDLLGYLHIARLLGDDAEVMERHSFRWRTEIGREVICPDVFFISMEKLKP